MDEATWTRTRHSACKGCNVKKAVREWNRSVPQDVNEIRDPTPVQNDVQNLLTALDAASKKLKGVRKLPHNRKSIEATEKLIDSWEREAKAYQTALRNHIKWHPKRKREADATIEAVSDTLDRALAKLDKWDKISRQTKGAIAKVRDQIRSADAEALGKLVPRVKKLHAMMNENFAQAKRVTTDLKGDAEVVEFRRLGGEKLVKKHALWKSDIPEFNQKFQATTRKFDEIQVLERKLGARLEKQVLVLDTLLTEADQALTDIGKAMYISKHWETAIAARAKRAKDFTSKWSADRLLRLNPNDVLGDPEAIQKQVHGTEGQLYQIDEKVKALNKILKNLDSMRAKAEQALVRLRGIEREQMDETLEPPRRSEQELRDGIVKWIREHEDAAAYAQEYLRKIQN